MRDDAPHRKPGRPPLDPTSPSTKVSLSLGGTMYDLVYKHARLARMGVPAFIRRQLARLDQTPKQ
jgi:hypothetical protein